MHAADAQCIREFWAAVRKLDAEGLPQAPRELTLFAQQLAMSLGVDDSNPMSKLAGARSDVPMSKLAGARSDVPVMLRYLARRLFSHEALEGNHRMLWRRMVNMIQSKLAPLVQTFTPSCRAECKLELKGYGWQL
jgi:hypothetical protein